MDQIREMQAEIQKEIYRDDAMQKQSIALSVILTADRIATDRIFCDGEYIDIESAKKVLASQSEVSEHERCYRYLLDKISMNSQRFDAAVNVEQWGIIDQGYAIMYVQAVKDLCESGSYSYKAFMNWADKNGLLQTDGKNQTKNKKMGKKAVRCVWLKLDSAMDSDGFSPADQEELPFK